MKTNTIHTGDALETLKTLPDESVDCAITSPPYFGLRFYSSENEIGRESSVEDYVENITKAMREVRRVLKKNGTLWLNLGDTYSAGGRGGHGAKQKSNKGAYDNRGTWKVKGFGQKQLLGIPWRVALALQADGWTLRQDVIWHKPNAMPESVTDRCAKSHEYVFILAKSTQYYFDHKAIQTPAKYDGRKQEKMRASAKYKGKVSDKHAPYTFHARAHKRWQKNEAGERVKNRRSVWTINNKPFHGAHFAVFPEALVEPMVQAGSPQGGIVLDPFAGAGTTLLVAKKLGRRYLGIELNPEYVEIARQRLAQAMLL